MTDQPSPRRVEVESCGECPAYGVDRGGAERCFWHTIRVTPEELGRLLALGSDDQQAEALQIAAEETESWGYVKQDAQLCYIGKKLAQPVHSKALDMLRRIVEFADLESHEGGE